MTHHRSLVGLTSALLLLVASCGGTTAETTTTTAPTTSTTTTTEPEPMLVSDDLVGFETRSIVFANVELTVTAVRVSNQELRSYAEGAEPVVDEESFYAYLDITALNRTSELIIGLEADEFQLVLGADALPAASEMSFLSDLTGALRANAAVDTFLAFPVPEGSDLTGAVFRIGLPPDRPAALPLTGEVPPAVFPLDVAVAGTAEGVGPTNGGTIVFTVLGATLSEDVPHQQANSPTGLRADEDELFLVVHVRAEKVAGRGADLLGGDGFRLLVDGVPQAPWDSATDPRGSTETPTVDAGAAVEAWVAFMLPVDFTELALQVGDFEEDPGIIPLEIPDLPS